jgi:hypothetical protein
MAAPGLPTPAWTSAAGGFALHPRDCRRFDESDKEDFPRTNVEDGAG